MRHFMDEGGQHLGDRTHMEIARVKRDLVRDQPVSAAEAVAAKIPVAPFVSLQRDEAIRQLAFEQGPVETRVGFLKLVVRSPLWVLWTGQRDRGPSLECTLQSRPSPVWNVHSKALCHGHATGEPHLVTAELGLPHRFLALKLPVRGMAYARMTDAVPVLFSHPIPKRRRTGVPCAVCR
jgi:hypothetical protein